MTSNLLNAPSPSASIAHRPRNTLAVLRDLLEQLHEAGIRYCHWKSNEHLGASMVGATDLDILVDRRDAREFARLLAVAGVKPFRKLAGNEYPGVEDYLAFDAERGAFSHLHVHYQLTLGEKFLKGYRLPWETRAIDTRVFDAEHQLYVIDPHLELLVLVVRAAIKLRARDWILAARGTRYMSGGLMREFRWLIERISPTDLGAVARTLVGDDAAAHLLEIVNTPVPSMRQLSRFRAAARPELDAYRMYGSVGGLRRRLVREWSWLWVAAVNRSRGLKKRSTKVSPTGGLAVAVVGPQTEATSLARQLITWLSPEMAVVPDMGTESTMAARHARGRSKVVIADRLRRSDPVPPDLLIELDPQAAPASQLLTAKRALWESI